ncbi:MAG: ATP-binding protein [Acidimicrobiales bacterium]
MTADSAELVFLFTDVVGSTRSWAEHPAAMSADLADHDDLIRRAMADHGGLEFATAGDSFAVVFETADDAVGAAIAAQRALGSHAWQVPGGLRVRMGLHCGEAQRRSENFYGPTLNEAARIMSVGHGGQIVASEPVAASIDVPTRPLGTHRLRDLAGSWSLHQIEVPGTTGDHPSLRSSGDNRSTLPAQRSSLVGRTRDLATLRGALRSHQLVTLLGPGGAGKTRTAIEAAGQLLAEFEGGAFFVDLTTVEHGSEVVAAFVDGLARAVPPERSPIDHVLAELAGRRALVVIDNCEHVVDAVASLVDQALVAAPDVHVLATSRVALGVDGEHAVVLAPLPTDSPDSPGVRLFVERALATDVSLRFDEATLDTVAQIATRLDGMPLAIELAAARCRTLAPQQILANLDDRFRLLVGHKRRDPRQRTLEAAIAWSYDLLDEDDQRTFRALSVCAGHFTLRTTTRLLGDDEPGAIDALDSLVEKSLVQVVTAGETERSYRLLDSLRAFGLERLAATDETETARLNLESALIPDHEVIAADFAAFADVYCDWTEQNALETTTRRVAATHAFDGGRFDVAALIILTATSPEEPGAHARMLEQVAEISRHAEDLGPVPSLALSVATMWLQSFTFRLPDLLVTSGVALEAMADTDPDRRLVEAFHLLPMTVIDPYSVVASAEGLLARAIDWAAEPYDYAVAMMAIAYAVGLLAVERIEEAHDMARLAVRWARPGSGGHDAVLATLVWMEYTEGLPHGPEFAVAEATPWHDYALPRINIAAAIAAAASVEQRAAELCELARRRPLGAQMYEESLYLVAFAWLALEEGDLDRASVLLDAFATVDPGSGTAGVRALDRIARETKGEPLSRDEMLARFVDPGLHDRLTTACPRALADELARWDARLAP